MTDKPTDYFPDPEATGVKRSADELFEVRSHPAIQPAQWQTENRRLMAIWCLAGQTFGFTQEDVDAITRCLESDVWITVHQYRDAKPLESIRDRIAALLPPP